MLCVIFHFACFLQCMQSDVSRYIFQLESFYSLLCESIFFSSSSVVRIMNNIKDDDDDDDWMPACRNVEVAGVMCRGRNRKIWR